MRKLNGFIYCCVLAMMCGTASAQIKIVIDNQEIPTEDIQSITILPNTNLISIVTNVAYTVQAADATPTDPDAVSMTFSQSASSITEDQSVTLSWSTVNASSCTTSGGTGGWDTLNVGLPDGSAAITIATAGTYTFTLTCNDISGGSVVKNATVTASTPATTKTCSAPALSGTVVSWKDFWMADFPNPLYQNEYASIPMMGYLALEFNTGSVVSQGRIFTIETTVTDGVRLGSVSECPGDFDVAPECDYIWGISGGIEWATNGNVGDCQLKPDTTYYFNVTYTDGVNPATTSCDSSPCITTVQHVNR